MSDEQQPEAPEAGGEAGPEPATEPAGQVPGVPEPVPEPADSVVAVPDAQDPGAAAVPKAAPKKRGRPPGSKNKPKPPPQTVPAESADPGPGNQPEQAPAVAPEPEPEPRHPVHLTPVQMRRVRQISQPAEPLRAAGRGVQHGRVSKATMMPLERRNEPQMLRSFWKQYPSYRVQPLLYKRYNELLEARALNEWLENRRIRKEGEEYTDAVGRLTDTVNRRLPQLRYAPARRAPRREGRGRGTEHSGVGSRGRRVLRKAWRRGASTASGSGPTTARCWATSRKGSPSAWSCRSAMLRSTWPATSTSTISPKARRP